MELIHPKILVLAALTLAASLGWVHAQVDRITGAPFATRSEVMARQGMVATSQPLATQVGVDILRQGGTAVDAAIAANAALGLMEPTGCGIGGDLFALVWDADQKKLFGLNASGRSPRSLTYEIMKAQLEKLGRTGIPPYGLLPITVPGAVDGWFELHDRFGKLPMKAILAPAMDYARQGFPLSQLIAFYWARSVPILKDQPGAFLQTFTLNGRAPGEGEIFRNPDLANTYAILAEKGRDAFYQGELAQKMDAFFREVGGYLRLEDFKAHTSSWVEPLSVDYRGYQVYELPPNGQGMAVLQMLQILKRHDVGSMGYQSADLLHLMIEAKKLVYEDRAKYYADPDFSKLPIRDLISEAYAAHRDALIDPERASSRPEPGTEALIRGDTIYLTTADQWGNMVSLIQSNYRGIGSGVVVPGLGFSFQDRGQLFHMDPDHANVYAPGKRPFHTIIPAFVTHQGKPFMSFGVMGGAMQPQGHVQILVNIIDFGMNLQEAGDAPRWQHFGSTTPTGIPSQGAGFVELESGIPFNTVRELIQTGHDIRYGWGGFGGYQAIGRDPESGVYRGASESRKDGQAAGY